MMLGRRRGRRNSGETVFGRRARRGREAGHLVAAGDAAIRLVGGRGRRVLHVMMVRGHDGRRGRIKVIIIGVIRRRRLRRLYPPHIWRIVAVERHRRILRNRVIRVNATAVAFHHRISRAGRDFHKDGLPETPNRNKNTNGRKRRKNKFTTKIGFAVGTTDTRGGPTHQKK